MEVDYVEVMLVARMVVDLVSTDVREDNVGVDRILFDRFTNLFQ